MPALSGFPAIALADQLALLARLGGAGRGALPLRQLFANSDAPALAESEAEAIKGCLAGLTGKSGGADNDLVLAKAVKMQDNREAGRLAAARRIQGKIKEKLHEQYKRTL